MERFIELVNLLTKEWDESKSNITCEFSSSFENIEEKMRFLSTISPVKGTWVIGYCKVCEGYHADKPLHVEIVSWP